MEWFYLLGPLHGLAFLITACVIIYVDHRGLNYFRGKEATLPTSFVTWSHRLVWTGLILMIVTGASLVSTAWEYYLTQPAYLIKMSFVGVLVINAFAIGTLSKKATSVTFADLSKNEKITLLVSGALSGLGWVGAAVIGFFIL